jgi:SAM-dependent methyltransferase
MSLRIDVRKILGFTTPYRCFQRLLGGSFHRRFVNEYVRPRRACRVLDVGCGPADVLACLPDADYVGVDNNPDYIDAARRRFGHRGRFICQDIRHDVLPQLGAFDLILVIAVLHHLSDDESRKLLQMAASALKPDGRLVTLDGCYVAGQSRVARRLLSWDRGRFVRTQAGYVRLAKHVFPEVAVAIRHDLLRVPYTHIVMQCRPRVAVRNRDESACRAA